ACGVPHMNGNIGPIGDQPAASDEIGRGIDRRQLVLLGKRSDLLAMNDRQRACGHDHAIAAAARKSRDAKLGTGEVAHIDREDLNAERGRHGLNDGVLPDRCGLRGVPNNRRTRCAWHDLLEQLQPFAGQAVFELYKTGGVASWPRQAVDKARADGIRNDGEDDRHSAGDLQQLPYGRAAGGHDDVRRERHQFGCVLANHAGIAAAPAGFDPRVAADDPAELRQCLHEYRDAFLASFLVRNASERRNASCDVALLRGRRERPSRRAADEGDELASFHSITSSARDIKLSENFTPSALAVLRLITNSNLVGCMTGRSAGLAPFRTRPAYTPTWRYTSGRSMP